MPSQHLSLDFEDKVFEIIQSISFKGLEIFSPAIKTPLKNGIELF